MKRKPKVPKGLPLDAWSLADKVWKRNTAGKISVYHNHANPKNMKYDEQEFFLFKLGIVVI